jgi:hypothetical protein
MGFERGQAGLNHNYQKSLRHGSLCKKGLFPIVIYAYVFVSVTSGSEIQDTGGRRGGGGTKNQVCTN